MTKISCKLIQCRYNTRGRCKRKTIRVGKTNKCESSQYLTKKQLDKLEML